ncbi:LPXTG cell wall anchor domain-containing protein [Catellatospora sp. NPDC049111]|uniref:LPXTG cell wall anchor domain-containing protein n=1 Tax=Catellatospora sp. NPDC049111 TaxID=3155271 RepID=UPI0033CA5CAE
MHVVPGPRLALRLGAVATAPLAAAVLGLATPALAEPTATPSAGGPAAAAASAPVRDLAISATPTYAQIKVGETAKIKLTVKNLGDNNPVEPYYGFLTTTGIQVVAAPAECVEYDASGLADEAAAAAAAEPEFGSYFDCTLAQLKAGATVTKEITVKLTKNSEQGLFAFADDWAYEQNDELDADPDNNYVDVTVRPVAVTPTPTPTTSQSPSPSPSASTSPSASASPSASISPSTSAGPSASASASASPTASVRPTTSAGASPTGTPSASASATATGTATASASPTSSTPAAGELPLTGTKIYTVAGMGAAVLLAGAILMLIGRRRRRA